MRGKVKNERRVKGIQQSKGKYSIVRGKQGNKSKNVREGNARMRSK